LSRHSGRPIKFEARTRPGGDEPEKRLELIGDFVRDHSKSRDPAAGPVRVIVLEDFAATHPRSWKYRDGAAASIRSVEDVQEYLRMRSTHPQDTSVKLVHTYDEWIAEYGLKVQIGTGLTYAKVCEAECFLKGITCDECSSNTV
jgi:hypothetical protein